MLTLLENALGTYMAGIFLAEGRPVPVFPHTAEGQLWATTFPCISFDVGVPEFDPARYVPDEDPVIVPISLKETQNGRTGSRRVKTRPHPKPYKIPVTFNLWAKTHEESNDLAVGLLRVFRPRGTFTFKNDLGNSQTWWMFIDGAPTDLSELYERLDEERKFQMVYRYKLEGWLEDIDFVKEQPTISSDVEVNIGIKDP